MRLQGGGGGLADQKSCTVCCFMMPGVVASGTQWDGVVAHV